MGKRWIGRWLMAVAVIHTLFAVVEFHSVLATIGRLGVLDAVGTDPMRGAVTWFVLFGLMLFIAGLAASALEQVTGGVLPRSFGWSLLGLAVLGIVLMPASGFWLVLPPAFAVLTRRSTPELAVGGT